MAMIVAIDGPAGAGKSTVSRELARRLGFRFLDTGSMYRAVALAGLRRGIDLADEHALAELAESLHIELTDDRTLVDGDDVSDAIRTVEVTEATRYAAGNPRVRAHLVRMQRAAAADVDLVTEGRDQGTVAFPHADCKIFLTASAEERARRRVADLAARGEQVDYDEVLAGQRARDASDAARTVGPLVAADDAVEVCTDGLSQDEVVDRLEQLVRARLPLARSDPRI